MLNIKDIITLAASGYKKDDIKELIELSKDIPEATPQTETVPPQPETETPPAESGPDYEALYKEQLQINSDLTSALKAAQSFNVKTDVSNNIADPLEEMQKLFR